MREREIDQIIKIDSNYKGKKAKKDVGHYLKSGEQLYNLVGPGPNELNRHMAAETYIPPRFRQQPGLMCYAIRLVDYLIINNLFSSSSSNCMYVKILNFLKCFVIARIAYIALSIHTDHINTGI